jgi:segregation and condensation protein A
MEYISTMQKMDMELSSEFIVMAAELMVIKSRMLLPKDDEDEEDPRTMLAAAVLEYKRAKEAAQKLSPLYATFSGRMEKDTDEITPDRTYVADHSVDLLSRAFVKIMNTVKITEKDQTSRVDPLIRTKTVSVSEKVFSLMRGLALKGNRMKISACFAGMHDRGELIATFMALLELLRHQRVSLLIPDETELLTGVIDICDDVEIVLNREKKNREVTNNNDGE